MVFSVLVFIQSKWIGRVLIVVDSILPFLSQLKIVVDVPFHDHLLFGAQPWNLSLGVNHQHLKRKVSHCLCQRCKFCLANCLSIIVNIPNRWHLWLRDWSLIAKFRGVWVVKKERKNKLHFKWGWSWAGVHACRPNSQKAEGEDHELKSSQSFKAKLSLGWGTQRTCGTAQWVQALDKSGDQL